MSNNFYVHHLEQEKGERQRRKECFPGAIKPGGSVGGGRGGGDLAGRCPEEGSGYGGHEPEICQLLQFSGYHCLSNQSHLIGFAPSCGCDPSSGQEDKQ